MFEHYIYQPFFNILVGLYELLGAISPELADMGIAVIIFSVIIQIILFPLRLAGERSEEEKKKITDKIEESKRIYSHEPIKLRAEIKTVMRSNLRSVMATTANLLIGLGIIFMLYRIFTTGLEGADFYLLYDFVPRPDHINLMFLGKYDLSRTNPTLNLIQSFMIFLVEVLSALRSPFPISRKDKALLQIVLPIGSYIIFMFLPSGKKVFMITTLVFSAIYQSIKLLQEWGKKLLDKFTPKPPVETGLPHESEAPSIGVEPAHTH
ncbi:MAG: YidC/Oxa1 family membrane protein insertase [bacterium]